LVEIKEFGYTIEAAIDSRNILAQGLNPHRLPVRRLRARCLDAEAPQEFHGRSILNLDNHWYLNLFQEGCEPSQFLRFQIDCFHAQHGARKQRFAVTEASQVMAFRGSRGDIGGAHNQTAAVQQLADALRNAPAVGASVACQDHWLPRRCRNLPVRNRFSSAINMRGRDGLAIECERLDDAFEALIAAVHACDVVQNAFVNFYR
jgi:hypothetical protein